MRKLFFPVAVLLLVVNLQAQNQQEEMKAYMESISPGPMHKMLAKMSGEWKTVTTFLDPATGGEMKSEGAATFEIILGGRYMKSIHSGTMMGMPFEGFGLDAYDNVAKEFVSIWADNMGTGIMLMKGKYDEKTNSLTFTGEGLEPMSKQMMKYRSVSKWINDSHTVFEMFGTMNGQ